MTWVLAIVGALIALLGVILVWGFLHFRSSRNQALAEIRRVELDEIESLAQECVKVFKRKFGVKLDPDDWEDAARKLDDAFRDRFKLKGAFERDDFYWYFVKPVGAFLGELLRRHARHRWRKNDGEAPWMTVKLRDGSSEVFPFAKAIKQATEGEAGDLVAYVTFALDVENAANELGEEQQ